MAIDMQAPLPESFWRCVTSSDQIKLQEHASVGDSSGTPSQVCAMGSQIMALTQKVNILRRIINVLEGHIMRSQRH